MLVACNLFICFLGVGFDSALTFDKQVNAVVKSSVFFSAQTPF